MLRWMHLTRWLLPACPSVLLQVDELKLILNSNLISMPKPANKDALAWQCVYGEVRRHSQQRQQQQQPCCLFNAYRGCSRMLRCVR
jgi:hypothetical protein